jgi:hypothetical protein
MVPEWGTEMRTVSQTVFRPETRETTCTVMRPVAVPKQITREICTQVPEQRVRTVNWVECGTTVDRQERQITVMVPYSETRTAIRDVCTMVPEQRTRTIHYTTCRTEWDRQERQYTVNVPYRRCRAEFGPCAGSSR